MARFNVLVNDLLLRLASKECFTRLTRAKSTFSTLSPLAKKEIHPLGSGINHQHSLTNYPVSQIFTLKFSQNFHVSSSFSSTDSSALNTPPKGIPGMPSFFPREIREVGNLTGVVFIISESQGGVVVVC